MLQACLFSELPAGFFDQVIYQRGMEGFDFFVPERSLVRPVKDVECQALFACRDISAFEEIEERNPRDQFRRKGTHDLFNPGCGYLLVNHESDIPLNRRKFRYGTVLYRIRGMGEKEVEVQFEDNNLRLHFFQVELLNDSRGQNTDMSYAGVLHREYPLTDPDAETAQK